MIRCMGQNIPIEDEACAVITYDMDASLDSRWFGDAEADPRVEERLPYFFLTRM